MRLLDPVVMLFVFVYLAHALPHGSRLELEARRDGAVFKELSKRVPEQALVWGERPRRWMFREFWIHKNVVFGTNHLADAWRIRNKTPLANAGFDRTGVASLTYSTTFNDIPATISALITDHVDLAEMYIEDWHSGFYSRTVGMVGFGSMRNSEDRIKFISIEVDRSRWQEHSKFYVQDWQPNDEDFVT